MSKDNFTKFYEEYVPKNAALKAQLDGIHNEDEFTKVALAEGTKGGFTFSASDVATVMETHKPARKAQLSDKQLDAVSGGVKAVANVHKEGTVMCCW
jgi:hypothetical protein